MASEYEYFSDDITFCSQDDCHVARCERHPSNIRHPEIPHSYAMLYRTEYCPLEWKPRVYAFGEWVPSSDRLPENRRYVLVTYKHEYGLIDHGITWYGEAEKKWDTSREVIAWMPLPECYKGE